jgi:cathepsin L
MVKAVLLASVLQAFNAQQPLLSFEAFIETHGRAYQQGTAEFEDRRSLYEQRKAAAELHNSQQDRLWNAGVNKLSDWTEAELLALQGWDGASKPTGGSTSRFARPHSTFLQQEDDLPTEKIWGDLGMSHNVKDQGACGSCWAIASASTLEGHQEIYSGNFKKYSAQQIVSCTPNPKHCGGEGGCKGATAELAMEWVMQNGLAEESVVPYTASNGVCSGGAGSASDEMAALLEPSKHKVGGATIGMTGWETLPKNKYQPLIQALVNSGPVAVSVGAGSWFQYHNGIFTGCGKDVVISHAVVAMGYGQQDDNKYWVIQNSWGADWGEQGHIRLLRHDKDEYCGMNNDPQKGVACKGETEPVPVCGMCGVLFDSVVPHFGNK